MRHDIYDSSYDARWLALADTIAQWSEDRATLVGCVIVGTSDQILSVGYNGFPRGIASTDERHTRPAKYAWTEHGERNAIYNAARSGISLEGATLVMSATPSIFPCADCARGFIQCGIASVVCDYPKFDHPVWGESISVAYQMLRETGVIIRAY